MSGTRNGNGFASMAEDEQQAAALVEYLNANPGIAKVLRIALGVVEAKTAPPPWAPKELQTVITPDGQTHRKIIDRGMTYADIGMSAKLNPEDGAVDFTFKHGCP